MPNQEFFQAAEAYGKRARRVVLPIEILMKPSYDGKRQGRMSVNPYKPFIPRWFLIEPVEGVLVSDVRYGAQSQFAGHGSLPTSFYSMDEALSLLESPDSPAWDRFKIEPADGRPLLPYDAITVELADAEPSPEGHAVEQIVRCVFIGDEPKFRRWEGEAIGTLRAVAMTKEGAVVEVDINHCMVKIPIAPADIPSLTEKLGRPVKFHLSTED